MTVRISRRTLLGATAIASLAFPAASVAAKGSITIATSIPLLQDIVANIAGDHAEVFSIMPPTADPHTWEAAPEDMVRLSESDAFIFFGADLEPFVETGGWRGTVQDGDIPELEVSTHVELRELNQAAEDDGHGHDEHASDPHFWLDPLTLVQAIPAIAAFLAEMDAGNADTYLANGESYVAKLEDLNAELEASFGEIPENRRKMLVLHDAWRYFADRYDFEIIGVVMSNPDSEVSALNVVDLLKVVENSGVAVIFSEPQLQVNELEVLAAEGDVEIAVLLTDSFIDGVESYIELMQFNRDQLVTHLGN